MHFHHHRPVVAPAFGVEGWFEEDELCLLAEAVFEAARRAGGTVDVLEIGSYKGRSTVALACALRNCGAVGRVIAVDPHEGFRTGRNDRPVHGSATFDAFSANVAANGLTDYVLPVRKRAEEVTLDGRVGLALIDALHTYEHVLHDAQQAIAALTPAGLLAFHDHGPEFPGVERVVESLLSDGTWRIRDRERTLIVLEKAMPHGDA